MLKWKIFQYKTTAFAWLIFITLLFCFPGSALPKSTWFAKVYFDKWAHVGVFAVLLFLFCSAFNHSKNNSRKLSVIFLLYGLLIEIVQMKWVPRRDFDVLDILADLVGIIAGIFIWWWVYKKIDPCRNRGRNQN